MASKQPRRIDLTSDLKFMAQTTYATMFVLTVWPPFGQIIKKEERKKERKKNLSLLDLSASPQVKIYLSQPFFCLLTPTWFWRGLLCLSLLDHA